MMAEKLVSICIPTFNMAGLLQMTLGNIAPQAREFKDDVEICISNNASPDNTRQVVMQFKKKYPELAIKYNENERNLGFDRNLIKVVNLAEGRFVWMFGDDLLVENGLKEVVSLIRGHKGENIGLIAVGTESHGVRNGKKVITKSVRDKGKPKVFELNRKDVITARFDGSTFISALLLNNKLLKDMFAHDAAIAVDGSIGTFVPHMAWYVLMFMKDPSVKGYKLNKTIVVDNSTLVIRYTMESEMIIWSRLSRLKRLLLSTQYSKEYASLLNKVSRDIRNPVLTMVTMKSFGCFNYKSFRSVIAGFFQLFSPKDAIPLSLCFAIISVAPPFMLKPALKQVYKMNYGDSSEERWAALRIGMDAGGTTEKGYEGAAAIEP